MNFLIGCQLLRAYWLLLVAASFSLVVELQNASKYQMVDGNIQIIKMTALNGCSNQRSVHIFFLIFQAFGSFFFFKSGLHIMVNSFDLKYLRKKNVIRIQKINSAKCVGISEHHSVTLRTDYFFILISIQLEKGYWRFSYILYTDLI